MSEENWNKQEGSDLWLPVKEGDNLVGSVVGIEEGMYGKQLVIKKDDGSEVKTPSHKVLQARISKAKEGSRIKIVYLNEEPPSVRGQNPTKMYDVFLVD